jgi:formate dehydrogenase assembly factor FdhD
MSKPLIAKPVVKNQFWIVTDGTSKVGNVIADGSGFEVKLNGSKTHFKNTSAIKKQTSIEFQQTKAEKSKKEIPFNEYPTTKKVYNSMLDIKRKIHLFTKTTKSKCYHAAGWYVMYQSEEPVVVFCPKYIFIQRYEYEGPYKTEDEAKNLINI